MLAELCSINAVYPNTVYIDKNDLENDRNWKRTEIKLELREAVPKESFIYLDSVSCAVPDGCHQAPRIVEKDISLICEFLLESVSTYA